MAGAIYPGSFDPITNGHLDLIERASSLFDPLVILVCQNSKKQPMFLPEQRMHLIAQSLRSVAFSGHIEIAQLPRDMLLANYCKEKNIDVIVRGLRLFSDFEFEVQFFNVNKSLNKDIEVVFLPTNLEVSFISSSIVKEVASYGGKIGHLVPGIVREFIEQKNRK